MKSPMIHLVCLALLIPGLSPHCTAASSSAKKELQMLVNKIKGKVAKGQNSEPALASELAEFDRLLAKHKDEKTDDVAQILVTKATFYAQVLKDYERALAMFEQLKTDFPGTGPAAKADTMIVSIKRQQAASAKQSALAIGTKFPEFTEPDMNGRNVSLADHQGKVVLIDFWATWCGPCLREMPHVLATYKKHHASGFEVIGVSLDRAEARKRLISFTKDRKMPWPQIYDGGGWQSKLAVKHGITSIPATYLLDREGKIVAINLRGPALEKEVARLLAAK